MKTITTSLLPAAVTMNTTVTTKAGYLLGADRAAIQLVWTGGASPVGTWQIEVSNYDTIDEATASASGTWSTLTGISSAVAADGDVVFDLNDVGFRWVRAKYTRSSGSATLGSALFVAKGGA